LKNAKYFFLYQFSFLKRFFVCHSRAGGNPDSFPKKTGFLLEFIPMKIGAGMTNRLNTLFAVVFQKAKMSLFLKF